MLKGLALSRTIMSLLEIGRHPMTLSTISLCTRKLRRRLCFNCLNSVWHHFLGANYVSANIIPTKHIEGTKLA